MSRVTRTPISSSKGQRSRSQGRRHIVAASRTFCYLRPPVNVMLSYMRQQPESRLLLVYRLTAIYLVRYLFLSDRVAA